MSNQVKEKILNEYYKLFEFVQRYDEYFLRAKTWSVTAGSAGLVLGFKDLNIYILLVSGFLAICFWIIEVYFKVIQDSHIKTLYNYEQLLKNNDIPDIFEPKILSSYIDNWRANVTKNRWINFTLRLSVMLPHVLILLFSILGIILALKH
jgi:hypothetical protein